MITFLEIIRSQKFDIDYQNKNIDLKNTNLVNEVVRIFDNSEIFSYASEKHKLDSDFDHAEGTALIDGRQFSFDGTFGLKSIDRLIGKMARDPKYGTIDAVKDIHRMRIEVKKPHYAVRIAKILFEWLGGNLSIENKWALISLDLLEEYGDSYLAVNHEKFYDSLLGASAQAKSKSISADRQELKLSRGANGANNSIEIQIVLAGNTNEDGGYAHHSIYEMKGFIQEIITDKGYITQKHIQDIIKYYIDRDARKNNGKSSIPESITPELILDHIMSINLLKEIVKDERGGRHENRIFTTQKVFDRFAKNYPERAQNITLTTPAVHNIITKTHDKHDEVLKK